MFQRLARLLALAAVCSAGPAMSWEFQSSAICTLSHSAIDGDLEITFDGRLEEPYRLTLTRSERWIRGEIFVLQFGGARPGTLTTERHRIRDNGLSLSVTDKGFDNVLNGLEFNLAAFAFMGSHVFAISLNGAAPEVRKFRECVEESVA